MTIKKASQRTTFSWPVVIPSLIIISLLVLLSALNPKLAEHIFSVAQNWVTYHFSWFYTLLIAFFLILLIGIAISKYGAIRLGPDDAEADLPFLSWLSMLFAAGMGVGLMYFGVGEPLQHFIAPPLAQSGTPAAAKEAMNITFFHWGLHAWAIYGVIGLVLAYFGFRYNLPLTMRSGLYPFLKDKINGPIGHAVDIFALCSTIFGIATTVGYGVLQLSAGLHQVTNWQTTDITFQMGLIALVVGLAGLSAASGLGKGLRILSEFNLVLAIALMGFVLIVGPTLYLLGSFSENIGNYLSGLVEMTFRNFTYEKSNKDGWFGGWTILYWAWWISWAPFVGMFIARISRGRTIREFIVGVLVVPSAFNLLWMTIFGNGAIWIDTHIAHGALSAAASNPDALLFQFFSYLPFPAISSGVAVLLIAVFFITSADSGAFVIDNIATRGNFNSPVWQRLLWAAIIGIVACCLLYAGGLKALQAMTLIATLPLAGILLILCFGLLRGLRADVLHSQQKLSYATNYWTGKFWKQRLTQILHQSGQEEIQGYIDNVVQTAMDTMQKEFAKSGVIAQVIKETDGAIQLKIAQDNLREFVYGVRCVGKKIAPFVAINANLNLSESEQTYEPITFFVDGRKGYDIQYLSEQELFADILRQYERHLNLSMNVDAQLLQQAPSHQ